MSVEPVPVQAILERLSQMYPDAKCALEHETPFELLVATILSAQCTDVRVNIVTRRMFPTHNLPIHFATATPEEIGAMVHDCGLWQTKAKNIHEASRLILEKHCGEVPNTLEELIALPGVGRKTANVVLSNAFGVPAIAVDTHVFRVANRLGLVKANTPEETEKQLRHAIPEKDWSMAHHWLIFHGRQICEARRPRCSECALLEFCPHGKSVPQQSKAASSKLRGQQ